MPQSVSTNLWQVQPDGSVLFQLDNVASIDWSTASAATPGDARPTTIRRYDDTHFSNRESQNTAEIYLYANDPNATSNNVPSVRVRADTATKIGTNPFVIQLLNKLLLDADGASDWLLKAAAYEQMTAGGAVTVLNDSTFRTVNRADGNALGTGAPITIGPATNPTVQVQGNVLFQANADLWILVEVGLQVRRTNDNAIFEVPGARVRAHSYGTTDDTGRPQSISLAPHGLITLNAPAIGGGSYTYRPEMIIRCFTGLGGGIYIQDANYAQVSIARVA